MLNYHYTTVENNDVFQSWQKANPMAVIVKLQFIQSGMENVNQGAYLYNTHLGIIFTLPEGVTYP